MCGSNLTYKISKLYNLILKLNSEQNYAILYLIICFILIYNNSSNHNPLMFYLLFCLITLDLKTNLFYQGGVVTGVNKNLLNGLLIIHPIILYTSYGLIFYTTYVKIFWKLKLLFFNRFFFTKKQHYIQSVAALLLSMSLGSWWAEQELSWGGWWSWDFIEIISLNFLFILIFFIHMPKFKNFFISLEWDLLIKTVVFMIVVRFNFLDSIHNFIANNFFFQFFYQLAFFYLATSMVLFNHKFFNLKAFKLTYSLHHMFILFLLLIINLLIYLHLEFLCLTCKDVHMKNLFKKNKILYWLVLYMYTALIFKKIGINLFSINFFELIYLRVFFYNRYKNLGIYLMHFILLTTVYYTTLNFYFVEQNNFILGRNIKDIGINSEFINNNTYFIRESWIGDSFNDSIFYKVNILRDNIFLELFSFNNFILFITNINMLFCASLLFLANIFKLLFKKRIFI